MRADVHKWCENLVLWIIINQHCPLPMPTQKCTGRKSDDIGRGLWPVGCLRFSKIFLATFFIAWKKVAGGLGAEPPSGYGGEAPKENYFMPVIFLISFSLFKASIGVRLFISRFFISSLICFNTGSSSWKILIWNPSRLEANSETGLVSVCF